VMKRFLISMMIAGFSAGALIAQPQWPTESAALVARQRQERQTLKLKQRYARESLQNSHLPKAVRIQLKHELKQEQKKLHQRQKDERQTLKDRERLLSLGP
jgi:ribosomal protein L39E